MAIAEPQAVAPRPKLRWFQYSLRTLLVLMTLVAAGLGIYKWWTIVREQRRLQAFIRSCTELTESQRELFCGWVSDRALLQSLNIVPAAGEQLPSAAAIWVRPLVWQSSFVNFQGHERHIFVFGAFWRENAGVVVLCDGRDRPLSWNDCCIGGLFESAWLKTRGQQTELFIDASTNGLHPFDEDRGIYRFALEDKVVPLPILWEPIEILTTHYAMEMLKHRVMKHVRSGGRVPISLEQLPSQPGCMDSNVDGWGRKMELRFENRRATVISYGRDGKPGGTDDDEDIVGDFDATPEKDAGEDDAKEWLHNPTQSWARRYR